MDQLPPNTNSKRYQPYHPQNAERRKKPDWLVISVQWISILSWVLVVFVLANIGFSMPAQDNYMTLFKGLKVSGSWNMKQLTIAQYLLVANVTVCLVGLIANALRLRRKTDRIRRNLVVAGILSVAGMIAMQIFMA